MFASAPTASDICPSVALLFVPATECSWGLIMVMSFRNNVDNQRYAAAEDAFTSEGGYLAPEDNVSEESVYIDREARHPSRDCSWAVTRYAEGIRAVLAVFGSGGPRHAAQLRKCGSVQTLSADPPKVMGATSSIASTREEPS
ncbi:MAG TPA: hypothetical protein VGT79_07215 [Xanthomonadaceae bacterium]|nr:hypothetical protein [Xanthomonadaceae bacterium]